jgi:hypothetical protein
MHDAQAGAAEESELVGKTAPKKQGEYFVLQILTQQKTGEMVQVLRVKTFDLRQVEHS